MILIARPKPIIQGSDRVLRGGSWFNFGQYCRSADRHRVVSLYRFNYLGFRVILRKQQARNPCQKP